MAHQGNDHSSDGLGDRHRTSGDRHYLNLLKGVDQVPSLTNELLELRLTKASKMLAQSIAYPPDGTYPANMWHVVSAIERWAEVLLETCERTGESQRTWLKQVVLDVIAILESERDCSANDYAEGIYRLQKHNKRI
jgi:hypothetical protein